MANLWIRKPHIMKGITKKLFQMEFLALKMIGMKNPIIGELLTNSLQSILSLPTKDLLQNQMTIK